MNAALDSWGKMRPGLLHGEYSDFGHWNQCIQVKHTDTDREIRGKYCLYELDWNLPRDSNVQMSLAQNFSDSWIQSLIIDSDAFRFQRISNSICVPDACSLAEIQSAIHVCT